ncbi:MAG: F0F1 ATP synthase subunit A [Candidatus Sungbacteria bacterium]|nr:F0F1 ATP synthase subunit A [Candidatus Sungbacteria bacterium]
MLHISIAAEKLFEIFGLAITNTLLMSWITALLLIAGAVFLYRRMAQIPAAFQNIFESAVEWILGMMEGIFGSRQTAEKYFPIIATIFIFILVSNWLGILPGIGSVGFSEPVLNIHEETGHGAARFIPLFRSSASDLNFTLALAILAIVIVNIMGIRSSGLGRHLSRFFTLKSPVDFFVGILEFIAEFAKIVSFSFRLFGNVFAGEVLLAITAFLVPYFIPVPFLMLEVFVGFIQALVFSMLTMVFISLAVSHH